MDLMLTSPQPHFWLPVLPQGAGLRVELPPCIVSRFLVFLTLASISTFGQFIILAGYLMPGRVKVFIAQTLFFPFSWFSGPALLSGGIFAMTDFLVASSMPPSQSQGCPRYLQCSNVSLTPSVLPLVFIFPLQLSRWMSFPCCCWKRESERLTHLGMRLVIYVEEASNVCSIS